MSSAKLHYQLDLLPQSRWLTVTANPLVRASLLHVQEVGDFFAKSGYYTRREGLNSYLIKYTVSGEGVSASAENSRLNVTAANASEIVITSPELSVNPLLAPFLVLNFYYAPSAGEVEDIYVYFKTENDADWTEENKVSFSQHSTTGSQIGASAVSSAAQPRGRRGARRMHRRASTASSSTGAPKSSTVRRKVAEAQGEPP